MKGATSDSRRQRNSSRSTKLSTWRISDENCTPMTHEQIKRGVGLSVGTIQIEILEIINREYPELDDLN